ncbi:MAG: HAMP domain-containing histidine kinase [Verrucomicrobia bacterium]|nr:HAMP domain-containing histidine kinase [Verrucomicrobiota bacterium]
MSAPKEQSGRGLFAARMAPTVVILLTLAILGGTIFLASRFFRESIREHIIRRDAKVLYSLWLEHAFKDPMDEGLTELAETPAGQLEAVLELTKLSPLSGALGTRLFDANGSFVTALPINVSDAQLTPKDVKELKNFKPVSRFLPAARLPDFSPAKPTDDPKTTRPLLEITVPLHAKQERRLLGIAQFLLEGESLAAELAALDQTLFAQVMMAAVGSSIIVGIVLGLAFHQLQRVNRLLVERTTNLLKANQELTWAAKASAIGAVTSHLIHGLKNPLSGLQNFMVSRKPESRPASDTEWQLAVSTARRMQSLVNEVVRILREQNDTVRYEIELDELVQMIAAKVTPLAQQAGVHFHTRPDAEGTLANRDANLIFLILENLIQNAIQATPKGKTVTFSLESQNGEVLCEVRDEGPGLSESLKDSLFKPCQSTKEQGSGIGLAISKQLANHIGAGLDLKSTTPRGCVFTLVIPVKLLTARTDELGEPIAKASARS